MTSEWSSEGSTIWWILCRDVDVWRKSARGSTNGSGLKNQNLLGHKNWKVITLLSGKLLQKSKYCLQKPKELFGFARLMIYFIAKLSIEISTQHRYEDESINAVRFSGYWVLSPKLVNIINGFSMYSPQYCHKYRPHSKPNSQSVAPKESHWQKGSSSQSCIGATVPQSSWSSFLTSFAASTTR